MRRFKPRILRSLSRVPAMMRLYGLPKLNRHLTYPQTHLTETCLCIFIGIVLGAAVPAYEFVTNDILFGNPIWGSIFACIIIILFMVIGLYVARTFEYWDEMDGPA